MAPVELVRLKQRLRLGRWGWPTEVALTELV
jgi:hypothetical protein